MSKHSFAPKLTADEYLTLTGFNREHWVEESGNTVEYLANRGLLIRLGRVGLFSEFSMAKGVVTKMKPTSYRLSRRGELMRQRYQKQESDRRFREELKAG